MLGKNPFDSALFGLGLLTVLAALTAVLLLYRASRHNLSELRKSNERLTGYIEATSDWVWQTDEEHRFTYISPQFTEQTGIFTESMIGRSPIDILLKDSPELATRHRKTVEARRPYRDLTYSLVLPDGRRVWFRTNAMPRFDASGRFTGYLGTTRNITEAFTNKRQLDENLAITSHLLDAVPDAIVFCLPDRSIVKVNPEFSRLFGYTADEVRGKTTEFLYDDRSGYLESGNRTFDEKSERRFEPHVWRMKRKDGSIFMAEVVGSRVRNAAGEAIGNVGLLRNITQREEANAALLKAKEDAELANRSKSQFLAHMSHELRTPLNAILGFSEILQLQMHGDLGNPRYAEYVDDIHGSGELLLSMINDILDLSRVEAGKLELYEREIDPDTLITECQRFLRDRAVSRGITIQIGESIEGVMLFADERLVKQMLLNLLSNAVKFTPPDGTIHVFVTLDDAGDLRIAVADTGIGIAAEDIERVRRPFAQAHNVWQKTGEGAGIGLYLVESLIEAHGGSMHIASELGNGTIVTLRFPPSRVHRANGVVSIRAAG